MVEKADKSFLQKHWRVLLNIIVMLALVALAYGERSALADTISNLSKVNTWFLLLLIPLEFLNYDAQARLYRSMYRVVGEKLSYWFCFKLSLELSFIGNIFPSGGVSSITYFSARMRGKKRSTGQATIIQLMKLIMTYLSFVLVIFIGLVVLAAAGHANNLVILFSGILTTAIFALTGIFIFIVSSSKRIKAFSRFSAKALNQLADRLKLKFLQDFNVDSLHRWMDDLYKNYKQMEKYWRELVPAYWHAFFMNIWEVLAVYVVFLAFGSPVNIGAIILAYAVANLAGLISVLPSGAGIYEALMTTVLVVAGVPAGVSLPAVIMYRVINTLIQVPPGYYLYHRNMRRGSRAARA